MHKEFIIIITVILFITMALASTQALTERAKGGLSESKADNLTANCEPIV
jgi:hypothetical protein